MKQAQACYEIVPTVLMSPAMFQFFRLSATKSQPGSAKPFAILALFAGVSYVTAIAIRDVVYWPLVVQVYSQVNRIDVKKAYQASQAITLL